MKESQPFLLDSVKEVNLVDTKRRKKRINRLKGDQPNSSGKMKVDLVLWYVQCFFDGFTLFRGYY